MWMLGPQCSWNSKCFYLPESQCDANVQTGLSWRSPICTAEIVTWLLGLQLCRTMPLASATCPKWGTSQAQKTSASLRAFQKQDLEDSLRRLGICPPLSTPGFPTQAQALPRPLGRHTSGLLLIQLPRSSVSMKLILRTPASINRSFLWGPTVSSKYLYIIITSM